ncbi:HAD family hydrolase [Neptuniibacter halophilus]|uniref:HAD family hydrolase n=1 Tax=Neptuniibacter halophilus TaxID=651666 RepID=UPI0025728D35|nr:HAD family hydrolase [Neptuniibacter halophilus]
MIRCITFDLDDTLWAVDPVITHANQTMFEWLTENAPAFTRLYQIKDLPQLRHAVLEEAPEIGHSVTLIRQAQLRHGLRAAGYTAEQVERLTEQAFSVFIQARQEVVFFEHARETLQALKDAGYQLGALSNGNADVQRVGLGDLFDFQFKADDVGQMKPHPLMFLQMLEHTGLRPEQVVHVGDNPEHDIQGAAALGIWTIWIDLSGAGTCAEATEQTDCLSRLPDLVEKIRQTAQRRVTL